MLCWSMDRDAGKKVEDEEDHKVVVDQEEDRWSD